MNILVQVPDKFKNEVDIMRELSVIINIVLTSRPQKTVTLSDKQLCGSYKIVKRENGAIDYTLIVEEVQK